MLKKEITYEDFDGETVTETFYFNISKPELIDMEVDHPEGFEERMKKIINAKDTKALIKEFKEIILFAYGEKSEDGRRFIKNEELREKFSQTAAYQHLFMELAMNDNAAADFIIAVVPKDLTEEAKKVAAAATKKSTAEIAEAQKEPSQ